jgi:hypothetical protein
MRVYVVVKGYEYEGNEVQAIYTEFGQAHLRKEYEESLEHSSSEYWTVEDYEVEEKFTKPDTH